VMSPSSSTSDSLPKTKPRRRSVGSHHKSADTNTNNHHSTGRDKDKDKDRKQKSAKPKFDQKLPRRGENKLTNSEPELPSARGPKPSEESSGASEGGGGVLDSNFDNESQLKQLVSSQEKDSFKKPRSSRESAKRRSLQKPEPSSSDKKKKSHRTSVPLKEKKKRRKSGGGVKSGGESDEGEGNKSDEDNLTADRGSFKKRGKSKQVRKRGSMDVTEGYSHPIVIDSDPSGAVKRGGGSMIITRPKASLLSSVVEAPAAPKMSGEQLEVTAWLQTLRLPHNYLKLLSDDGFDDLETIKLITDEELKGKFLSLSLCLSVCLSFINEIYLLQIWELQRQGIGRGLCIGSCTSLLRQRIWTKDLNYRRCCPHNRATHNPHINHNNSHPSSINNYPNPNLLFHNIHPLRKQHPNPNTQILQGLLPLTMETNIR